MICKDPASSVLTGRFALLLLATGLACSPSAAMEPQNEALDRELERAVRLETSTGTIHGTLLRPDLPEPHPVVLIIAGSGPVDRNGNITTLPGPNNSLKMLAEGLAEHGIASVRYDKRGVGQSASAGPLEIDLRFDTYVNDAREWVRQIQADSQFSTVIVAGHSEGSLIGMIAGHQAGADAFVSIAGIARRASDVLRDQLRPHLPAELWEESERILAELEAGRTTDSVPAELFPLYRPSVQPYLISWFRYIPTEEVPRLQVPVLIAQGTTDLQVSTAEAEALKQARSDAELLMIDGMNHVLKLVPLDLAAQQASYSDPTLPVAPGLIEGLRIFIH